MRSIIFTLSIILLIAGVITILFEMHPGLQTSLIIIGLLGILLGTALSFKTIKTAAGKRSTKYGISQIFQIILVIAILVFIQLFARNHIWRQDFTENKAFTLDNQTKQILENLDETIKITLFHDEDPQQRVKDLIDSFKLYTDKVEFQSIDPAESPEECVDYQENLFTLPTIFVELGVKREKTKGITESDLANAIKKVTRKEGPQTVYFLTGHGEKDINNTDYVGISIAKQMLEQDTYKVEPLMLSTHSSVPEDSAVLVIAGPKIDPTTAEIQAIEDYILTGGKVIFMMDPQSCPLLSNYLGNFGISLGEDMIAQTERNVDLEALLKGGELKQNVNVNFTPVVNEYRDDQEITRGYEFISEYPLARSVTISENIPQGIHCEILLETEGNVQGIMGSWAETNVEKLLMEKKARYDEDQDIPGPVPIAVLADIHLKEYFGDIKDSTEYIDKNPKIIVFGDSDFIRNDRYPRGSGQIFANSINYLAEEIDLISIPPKEDKDTSLILASNEMKIFWLICPVVIPVIIIFLGVYQAVRRRRYA